MFGSPPQFQPKHGTAERWYVCDCDECLAGKGVKVCTAPPDAMMVIQERLAEDMAWCAMVMQCTCIHDWDGNLHPQSACKFHTK